MSDAFENIINQLPDNAKVLDVGCGGHEGSNTSNVLIERFGIDNIVGYQNKEENIEYYRIFHPDVFIIHGDFYKDTLEHKFDLIVLDLNIENNIQEDWEKGIERDLIYNRLRDKGIVILYAMMTDKYGTEDTGKMIRKHWRNYWRTRNLTFDVLKSKVARKFTDKYEIFEIEREQRRPEIAWVAYQKKKSGLSPIREMKEISSI